MPVARVPGRSCRGGANGRLEHANKRGPWTMEANGRLQCCKNKCLWPECLVEAAAGHFRGLRAGKRQAWTPWQQRAMEVKALRTHARCQSAWSKLPRDILGVRGRANGRLERPNKRGPWRQTAGFKALRPNAGGQIAWSKLPRDILKILGRANGRLERLNKRRPWRQTAGFKALRPNACGQSAWSKLPQDILGVSGRASGRLERPNNRGPWRQTADFKALRTNARGQSACSKLLHGILVVWGLANGRLECRNSKGHGGKRQASRL